MDDITITVATVTHWREGDQIVIAPSGWEVEEGEIRTIAAISGTGMGGGRLGGGRGEEGERTRDKKARKNA